MISRLLYILGFYLLLHTSCQKSEDTIDRIIIAGLQDFITLDESVNISAKAITGTDTTEIPDVKWITSDDGNYTLNGHILIPNKPGKTKLSCQYKTLIAERNFEILEHSEDNGTYYIRLENLEPPQDYYQIQEGSCGESVMWTICHYFGIYLSQEEINRIGGDPGRGLHTNEIVKVLDSLKIIYKAREKAITWESTVDTLKNCIKRGNPVILGVKIYPDRYPNWFCDHIILLTGMDTKSEVFYFNNFSLVETVKFSKLCNTRDGISLINNYNALFAVEIIVPH